MPYATNTDLVAEFPALGQNGGFTAQSKVTDAQVDEFCNRNSVLIDSKLAAKYKTPIDPAASPIAFSLLKEICVWMTYPRVAGIVGLPTGDSKTSTGANKTQDFGKKAQDTLKELQSGTMMLVDAPLATAADGAQSFTNDNRATLQPPQFRRKGDQW